MQLIRLLYDQRFRIRYRGKKVKKCSLKNLGRNKNPMQKKNMEESTTYRTVSVKRTLFRMRGCTNASVIGLQNLNNNRRNMKTWVYYQEGLKAQHSP